MLRHNLLHSRAGILRDFFEPLFCAELVSCWATKEPRNAIKDEWHFVYSRISPEAHHDDDETTTVIDGYVCMWVVCLIDSRRMLLLLLRLHRLSVCLVIVQVSDFDK